MLNHALPLDSPVHHRCAACGQTQLNGLRFENNRGGGYLCDSCAQKSTPQGRVKINDWLNDFFEIDYYDPEYYVGNVTQMYPSLFAHMLRKQNCGLQGTWKICGNSGCGKVHFFNGACGSMVCKRCGGILTDRLKKSLAHDLAPCPHHYGVFTLPPELRTGTWEDIKLLFKVVYKTLYDILGPNKKVKGSWVNYWGAWCSPHAYSSTDLSWHPHINVVCTTIHDINRDVYRARKLFDYAKVRKAFHKNLEEITEAKLKRSWQDLAVKFKLIMKPKEIIDNLVGYSVTPPLPGYITARGEELIYRVPHGSRKNPRQRDDIHTFISKLEALVPPKHFRAIRRWGIYNARHALYKEKPFTPVDTSPKPTAECGCCGESLVLIAVQGSSGIIHIDPQGALRNLDSNGFRSAYDQFIRGLCRCRNERSSVPPPSEWLEPLKKAHDCHCGCHKAKVSATQENTIAAFQQLTQLPKPDVPENVELLWEYYVGLSQIKRSGTSAQYLARVEHGEDLDKQLLGIMLQLDAHEDFTLIKSRTTGEPIIIRNKVGR